MISLDGVTEPARGEPPIYRTVIRMTFVLLKAPATVDRAKTTRSYVPGIAILLALVVVLDARFASAQPFAYVLSEPSRPPIMCSLGGCVPESEA